MPQHFEITLKPQDEADIIISGEFTDSECATLLQYLDQYEEIAASKPLRDGLPCDLSLTASTEDGIKVTASLPDADTLGILLHRMRPFVLKKEPASFDTVLSIIGKRVENVHIRALLRQQRELFNAREFQGMMRIEANGERINSERTLMNWLNSHEYHRDPDKRQAINDLLGHFPGEFFRGIFVSMLIEKVKAIGNIASLVALLLGKTDRLKFQTKAQV